MSYQESFLNYLKKTKGPAASLKVLFGDTVDFSLSVLNFVLSAYGIDKYTFDVHVDKVSEHIVNLAINAYEIREKGQFAGAGCQVNVDDEADMDAAVSKLIYDLFNYNDNNQD